MGYNVLMKGSIRLPEHLEVDAAAERLLKEYIAGSTVAQLVEQGQMQFGYLEQVQGLCRLLYPAGLNMDYYPTNFVVRDGKLWYIDYECNPYDPKWDFEHWGRQYWGE